MAISLANIRTALAALNGEGSAPVNAARDYQIQRTIEDIYYKLPWSWRRKTADVTFDANGQADAPADFTHDSFPLDDGTGGEHGEARLVGDSDNDDTIYTPISYFQRDNYSSGSNVVWVTGNEVDGYKFNIKETDLRTLSVTYYVKHDTLSGASDTTRIPLVDPIAKGAYMYMQKPNDIDRNNSTEQRDFEASMQKLYALENRVFNSGMRLISPTEKAGGYLGMV